MVDDDDDQIEDEEEEEEVDGKDGWKVRTERILKKRNLRKHRDNMKAFDMLHPDER